MITSLGAATRDVREHGTVRPPKALRDAHYRGAAKLGHGEGYVMPTEDPAGYEVDYLPDELKGRTYYKPSGEGEDSRASGRSRSGRPTGSRCLPGRAASREPSRISARPATVESPNGSSRKATPSRTAIPGAM